MKNRILWLSHLIPYPPKGGVLQRAYHLLYETSKYFKIDLLAFNQKHLMKPIFPDSTKGLKISKDALHEICNSVEFFKLPTDHYLRGRYTLAIQSLATSSPYNINWLKSKLFQRRLETLITNNHYDLIHFDTISLAPYLNAINRTSCVLDHHNIESHMLLRRAENEPNPLKSWYYRQEGIRLREIEKEYCPKFSLNITCSSLDKDRLLSISPQSAIEEVPNGVSLDYFTTPSPTPNPCSKKLVFMGTLSWYPNYKAAMFIAQDLWPLLKQSIPGVQFDIIGANPPEALLSLSNKDKNFIVHGFVDDPRPIINSAAAFVCPISDGGGTKLKILDAFAMSKAVVAHPIACEGITTTNKLNVLYAKTANEFSNQINFLLANDEERTKIGKAARTLVEDKYSYTNIGKKLSSLYDNCIFSYSSSH